MQDYEEALSSLYGNETFDAVKAHLDGKARFFALRGSDLDLKGFTMHQELIRIYTKIKEVPVNA